MKKIKGYKSQTQQKNIAWLLPRPKSKYKGSMPLYAEEWLFDLARDMLGKRNIKILNLFCGTNKQGKRVDINPKVEPDIKCDAHRVSKYFSRGKYFDVILADPPYSNEESRELYGIKIPLKYKVWTNECNKLLRKGGLLIVYHKYLMPNPNPNVFRVIKRVFIGTRTYHLPRIAVYFVKS